MSNDALSILQSITGFVQQQQTGPENKPNKMGTIDPDYSGTGDPKVTFYGETTLSGKNYPYMPPYQPTAGDRVVLVPVGTTYLIIGSIDSITNNISVPGSAAISGNLTVGGTLSYTPSASIVEVSDDDNDTSITDTSYGAAPFISSLSTTFTAPSSGTVVITITGSLEATGTGDACYLSYEIRENNVSGSVVTSPSDGVAVVVQGPQFMQASRTKRQTGLTPGATYFLRDRVRVSGGTGSVFYRSFMIVPYGA